MKGVREAAHGRRCYKRSGMAISLMRHTFGASTNRDGSRVRERAGRQPGARRDRIRSMVRGDIDRVIDIGAGTVFGVPGSAPTCRGALSVIDRERVCVRGIRARTTGHLQWRARRNRSRRVPGGPSVPGESRLREGHREHGAMCRGFLYVEAVTARDLREVCDRSRTDTRVVATDDFLPSRHRASLRAARVAVCTRSGRRQGLLRLGARVAFVAHGSTKHGELEIPPLGNAASVGWSGPAPRSSSNESVRPPSAVSSRVVKKPVASR